MGKINLELPSELVAELGVNDEEQLSVMRLELALALYSSGKLPPARAAVIAGLDRWNFSQEAKKRGVFTPYTPMMIKEDAEHAGSCL